MFVVPGNHDLKRNKTVTLALEQIATKDEMLPELEIEDDLKKRQKSFYTFIKKISDNQYTLNEMHTVIKLDKCNIVLLNTAWACGMDNEEGTLRIGLAKIQETLQQVEESNKVNIVLGHHTIDCFHHTERDKIINRFIDNDVDLYLSGHVHKPKYHFDADNTRAIPMFVCGAGMVDNYATNSFISGCIDLEIKEGQITYHSWHNEFEKWDIDTGIGRRVVNGSLSFILERFKEEAPQKPPQESMVKVDEDEFREFLIEFHGQFKVKEGKDFKPVGLDIKRKFVEMKCNSTVEGEYQKFSVYFPIVNQIMDNPTYLDGETRLIIPSVIVEEYQKVFDDLPTGNKIIEEMATNICNQYKNLLGYANKKLRIYIKILIYWSIQECDIFNDKKGEE